MKHVSLMLPEYLLDEAVRLSGGETYSRTVELALRHYIERAWTAPPFEALGSAVSDWPGGDDSPDGGGHP